MEFVAGNIFVRVMRGADGEDGFEPGGVVVGHTHAFDHVSVLFNGNWRVRKFKPGSDEIAYDITRDGPFFCHIEATAKHEFTFNGPGRGIGWCVYSHRHPNGEVSEQQTGFYLAYDAVGP
jgi:hypothetical protein